MVVPTVGNALLVANSKRAPLPQRRSVPPEEKGRRNTKRDSNTPKQTASAAKTEGVKKPRRQQGKRERRKRPQTCGGREGRR